MVGFLEFFLVYFNRKNTRWLNFAREVAVPPLILDKKCGYHTTLTLGFLVE